MIRSFPTTLMQDPVFRLRTPDARLLMFTLWMHPSNHLCGLFVLDLDHMALDVRLPLERTTAALAELITHQLVMRHAPLDQVWVVPMAGILGNLANDAAPVHKAVSKYAHGLVPSTLCHRVCDTLSIPYRFGSDFPDLCPWLHTDPAPVSSTTSSDTLSNRVPDRVLSVSGSGLDSGSGTGSGSVIPTSGIASRPVVTVESQPTRSEVRARAAEKASEKAAAKLQQEADRAAKKEADRIAKEEKRAAAALKAEEAKAQRAVTTRSNGAVLFAAYRDAFMKRYGAEPLRDARTGTHFARIGTKTIEGRAPDVSVADALAEACQVCAAYVRSQLPYYVLNSHPPGLLERDWHKLLTEHRTGRVITPQITGKSAADIKREAELDAYFARQDRKHDAIEVASEETRREF